MMGRLQPHIRGGKCPLPKRVTSASLGSSPRRFQIFVEVEVVDHNAKEQSPEPRKAGVLVASFSPGDCVLSNSWTYLKDTSESAVTCWLPWMEGCHRIIGQKLGKLGKFPVNIKWPYPARRTLVVLLCHTPNLRHKRAL